MTQLWSATEGMFSSQTRARAVNMRLALPMDQKGNQTVVEFVGKMRALGDEMAAARRPLDKEKLVEYILTGLDHDFSPVVSALVARTDQISINDCYNQLLAFETRMELMAGGGSGSSANMANCDRGGGCGRGYNNRGRGNYNDNGRGRGNGNHDNTYQRQNNTGRGGCRNSSTPRPICQVCFFKDGHTADRCWYRIKEDYVPEDKHPANAAFNSYHVDTNWYTDTGATDHVTGELEKLALREKYNGTEQIHTANGAGMNISHIDHSTIRTPERALDLNNILHVPSNKKNLVSVHRLTTDNNEFVEFHPDFFCLKDRDMRNILLRGACRKGFVSGYSSPNNVLWAQGCCSLLL